MFSLNLRNVSLEQVAGKPFKQDQWIPFAVDENMSVSGNLTKKLYKTYLNESFLIITFFNENLIVYILLYHSTITNFYFFWLVFIVPAISGRGDIEIVMILCNPERYHKGYAWNKITLEKRTLNFTTIRRNTLFGKIWSQNSKLFRLIRIFRIQ